MADSFTIPTTEDTFTVGAGVEITIAHNVDLTVEGGGGGGGGAGDVVGPAAAVVDGRPVLFDGTTGKLIKAGSTNTADGLVQLNGSATIPDILIPASIARDSEVTAAADAAQAAAIAAAATDASTKANTAEAVAISASQPRDADLTAIAALTTTATGRSLLAAVDAAALRTILGLGTAATTAASAYESAGAAATAQAAAISAAATDATTKANAAQAAAIAASQPLDSDLTSIAALSTASYGRSLLTLTSKAALTTAASEWTEVARYTTATSNDWPTFSSVPTADRYRLRWFRSGTDSPSGSGGLTRNLLLTFDGNTTSGDYFNTSTSATSIASAVMPQGGGARGEMLIRRTRFTSTIYGAVIQLDCAVAVGTGAAGRAATAHSYRVAAGGVPALSTWALSVSNADVWAVGWTFVLETGAAI